MQIDSLSTIITGMTVPQFRTLCLKYIKLLGYSEASLTDGPYDGVKDYKLLHDSSSGKSISIAMSTTPKWKKKLYDDINNMKVANPDISNVFYFSSVRMPEGTFQKYQEKIAQEENIFVIKYDSQTIASDFVEKNKVLDILKIANIDINSIALDKDDNSNRKLLNKNVAVSSLLLFGENANELRKAFFESIIETQIKNSRIPLSKEALIELIIDGYSFEHEQAPYINSQFDRLLQTQKISVRDGLYYIEECEDSKLEGIETQFNLEFTQIEEQVIKLLIESDLSFTKEEMDDLLDNIEDFILGLVRNSIGLSDHYIDAKGTYMYIRTLIEKKYNKQDGSVIIDNLLTEVSKSQFAKRIACTEMIIDLFNLDSDDLLNIFKAKSSLEIHLDTSVVIPLLCSLLWGEFHYRYSYSAKSLYELLKSHSFKMFIMDKYIEEIASHLIDAARIYEIVDKINEPLISQNAFITHYTLLHRDKNISFQEYLDVFDIKLSEIPSENDSNYKFREARKKLELSITELLIPYGINTINCFYTNFKIEYDNLSSISSNKVETLLNHDANVIKYLSTHIDKINSSHILCTWDRSLMEYKSKFSVQFNVLSPIALIDLTSMAKGTKTNHPLASYINFAKLQDEQMLEMASGIWEILIQIEKNELLDAELITKARKFQNKYSKKYQNIDDLDIAKISSDWLAWKEK